jgi:hypothetical protein
MRRLATSVFLLLAFALPALSQEALHPSLESIIQQNEQALGGRTALDRVQSVWRQRNARTFTLRQKPNNLLVVLLNEGGGIQYAEGFDGTTAWEIQDDGRKQPVSKRARTALWHTTQLPNMLRPLARIREGGHELALIGREEIDDVNYFAVLVTLSDGFERTYYLHPGTFMIERSRDIRRHHAFEDEMQPIESTWSDFRSVGPLTIPFTERERNYETGEQLSEGTMVQIRLNVLMPETVFAPDGDLTPFLDLVRQAAR